MAEDDTHYLKQELYELVRTDPQIFDFLQRGSLDGIWYWDLENPENEWMSTGFWELLGQDPSEKAHLASEWQDLINPDDLETALHNFHEHCRDSDHPYDQIVRYRHKDGSTVWVRCRGIAIRVAEGKPLRLLGAHNDLTRLMNTKEELEQRTAELEKEVEKRREIERELEHFATHDTLTGLPRRSLAIDRIDNAMAMARRNKCKVAVMFVDLDGFKEINDTFGHDAGDQALRQIAGRIAKVIREVDTVARLGGDEFLIVLPNIHDNSDAEIVARKIVDIVANPLQLDRAQASLGASIGIAIYPDHGETPNEPVKQSDGAMYKVKRAGKSAFKLVGA